MILKKEKFIDRMFWFYYFKRSYLRYIVVVKENLIKYKGENADFFVSMREHFDNMEILRGKLFSEISKNAKELSAKDLEVTFIIIQSFLDSVYDELDTDFANNLYIPLHPSIPSLQNEIRRQINSQNEDTNNLTFKTWFFDEGDIELCISALQLVTPPIINDKYEYLLTLNDKGAITAWVDILYQNGYVKYPGNKLSAPLINSKIKNLGHSGISERTLRSPGSTLYRKYLIDLKYLLPKK